MLGQALVQQSTLLLKASRASEAAALSKRTVDIQGQSVREHPDSIYYKATLASALRASGRALAAAGRPGESVVTFERAAEIDRVLAEKYPSSRYDLACTLALIVGVAEPVRRGALSAQAIATLRRAVSDGFANVALLKTDSDLDALRKDPAFKSFLSDLVFPDAPFARAE